MIRFEEGGWWLPDGEAHLQEWMLKVNRRVAGRLTYQCHKYEAARSYVRARRVAVDVGAHVGLWSWMMAQDFARVIAFEPMAEHRACFEKNVAAMETHVTLNDCALGAKPGKVRLARRTPNSSGDTGVEPMTRANLETQREEDLVALRTLDEFALPVLDFLKIDCEGYELFVLQGARETLKRCKPCIIVEQKPETGMVARYGVGARDAVTFLERLGARVRRAIQGDYILTWDRPTPAGMH